MLPILTAPNEALSKPAKVVKKVDAVLLDLIEGMKRTLANTHDPEGVGLAAPQVGSSFRLFISKPWPKSPYAVFINPQIVWVSQQKTEEGVPQRKNKLEGCLSLPNIWGLVKRAKQVKLRYQTFSNPPNLRTTTRFFSGFLATIIQHELDHLDGILFPKRVLEQKGKLYKSHKDEKGEDVFEEIEI